MSDDLVEGKVRRARPLLLVAAAIVVLVALPLVARSPRSDAPVLDASASTGRRPGSAGPILRGRLVYTAFETTGFFDRQQRLWTLDLRTSELVAGPLSAPTEELLVVDPELGTLLVVAAEGGTGVASLVDDLSSEAEPREVARGDVLALATDRASVVIGREAPGVPGCRGRAYEVFGVDLATRVEEPLGSGCGRLLGLASHDGRVLVSEIRGRQPVVRALGSAGVVLRGYALVSVSPDGTLLLADPERQTVRSLGVWPETATGALFLWRGTGVPTPVVDDVRLFGERLVTWAPDGSAAVVSGIVGGDRAMYLVRDGIGSALLPPNSFPLRSAYSGASFDDTGVAFAASVGHVVVTTPTGVEAVQLPAGAPVPLGPVVWLP